MLFLAPFLVLAMLNAQANAKEIVVCTSDDSNRKVTVPATITGTEEFGEALRDLAKR